MTADAPIRIGTRGSDLALFQAESVRDLLTRAAPMREAELVVIKTLGDRVQDRKIAELGRTAVFTAELDHALLAGDIDVAVHSLKDVETTLPEGITLAAILPRGPVEDVLVGVPLADLRPGARVGTGSVRRRAQLLALRPDLELAEIRGNVPTRLRKVENGDYDALVMARAGLVRLGFAHRIAQVFRLDEMLPAAGQGAIAVACRGDDASMTRVLADMNHAPTAYCTGIERATLNLLGAGCNVPLGVLARLNQDSVHIDAAYFPGGLPRRMTATHPSTTDPSTIAATALAALT